MKKFTHISINALPIIIMIALIPWVKNDSILTVIYIAIILIALGIKKDRHDLSIFAFGFCIMIISEYFFISTGVETFNRNSLFGLMPVWLPFLWGYVFVVIKRVIGILMTR